MAVDEASSRDEGVHEPGGNDHEAQTERVEKHLGEGADIDDRTRPIQAVQRGDGPAEVAILGVVLIFHDSGACVYSRSQESQAVVERKGYAQRELICRRRVNKLDRARRPWRRHEIQALLVDGDRNNVGSGSA